MVYGTSVSAVPEQSTQTTLARQRSEKFVFHLSPDYEVISIIGQGAYGVVCAAIHKKTRTKVAIKKVCPFGHPVFCLRTLREIKLLKYFQHENIISILDILPPPSYQAFQEVYIVQELMETDLHRVIRSQPLSDDHCQYFLYQLLRALKMLHSAGVIHRDLKPSNLLLNANCDLKVADFGLARSVDSQSDGGFMTEYVATRWYRAPEIMLSNREYTKAIDVWSAGCILAEMISTKPLFPGKDYHNQISLIIGILGTPTMDDFNQIKSRRARDYIRSLPLTKRVPFKALLPNANPLAIDLLERMLTLNPEKRITVDEALGHPYVAAYHDPTDEPVTSPIPQQYIDIESNKERLTTSTLKSMLYHEILC
ncbi:CMGC/MAPK/ERK protein kinase Spk1 [Schizosaccharomyces japonicus yFS275]|uniref:Mitogen-activated protein kinase n=1 Tax=Schizosaccharomyces japonicus (strain yFS275 / FY16936) TaxID=402676 RepID=B6K1J3_SCHJY|nr:CMGC/MAPK/ERK protein kinase Spk1 [Schizosaccharomyces japonicus yFS275]EEB07814.1 CMGC/MAPK/ERK protein kinase Spk1 [Schizosaccharomyces japonicus yFS275]